jgi:hypothetical protein
MYLTINDIDIPYPSYQKTSLFVNSYKNCFAPADISKNRIYSKKDYNISDVRQFYNLTYEVFTDEQFAKYIELDEDTIVSSFMNSQKTNFLSVYYKDFLPINPADFPNINYESYLCYAISIIKSMFIRDAIFERKSDLVDRYLFFINDKYMFQYPIDFITIEKLKSLRYYDISKNANCNISYQGPDCFTNFNTMDYNQYQDKIYFAKPLLTMDNYGKNIKI